MMISLLKSRDAIRFRLDFLSWRTEMTDLMANREKFRRIVLLVMVVTYMAMISPSSHSPEVIRVDDPSQEDNYGAVMAP
jgi:hypothetical protein